jgi:hypothetical protein
MLWIWEHADKLGNLGELVTAIVACIAIIFAYRQIVEMKKSQREATASQREATAKTVASQREATAKDIYRDFLKLAIEYPSYADAEKKDAGYKWYVAFLLAACDEMLSAMPGDEDWKYIIKEELFPHRSYLKSPEFKKFAGWDVYSNELMLIGKKAVNESGN